MSPEMRYQLRSLDRALLSLIDERQRLLAEVDAQDPGRFAAIEDILARHDGPFPAEGVRAVFEAIDRHSSEDARR
jgi:hypothetical protein